MGPGSWCPLAALSPGPRSETSRSPGGPAAQGSAPHWRDLGVFWHGWAALRCPAVRVLAQAALPGPPSGGHLCPSLGSPGRHPEAGLLVAGCSRERRGGGTSRQACPGGAWAAQHGAFRGTELCLTGCHGVPFCASVVNRGMVGEHLRPASCRDGCAAAAPLGTVWGPWMWRDPRLGKPGSALTGLRRGPYLLPPPWELATHSAPVNFLFLFLFLSC